MSTPDPIKSPGWTPSAATYGTGLGGAVALLVIAVLESQHIAVSGTLAAAIVTVCSTLAGYLPAGGRK